MSVTVDVARDKGMIFLLLLYRGDGWSQFSLPWPYAGF